MSGVDPQEVADYAYNFGAHRVTNVALYYVLEHMAEEEFFDGAREDFQQHRAFLHRSLYDYGTVVLATEIPPLLANLVGQNGRPAFDADARGVGHTIRELLDEKVTPHRGIEAFNSYFQSVADQRIIPSGLHRRREETREFVNEIEVYSDVVTDQLQFSVAVAHFLESLLDAPSNSEYFRPDRQTATARPLLEIAYLHGIRATISDSSWVRSTFRLFRKYPALTTNIYISDTDREALFEFTNLEPAEGWLRSGLVEFIEWGEQENIRALADLLAYTNPALRFDLNEYIDQLPGAFAPRRSEDRRG